MLDGICLVSGRLYRWSVIRGTAEFPPLTRALGFPQVIDVLRIIGEAPGFDVVIRIDKVLKDNGKSAKYLGPMLCISDSALLDKDRHWPSDALLRLRPRIASLEDDVPFGVAVERLVQWCTSPGFRAVRVKATGSLWVNHGSPSQ